MIFTFLSIILGAVIIAMLRMQQQRKELSFKGPPMWPLIGNFPQVPVHHPWVTFAKWKKEYGDVIALTIFGRRLLVLNSKEAALDLFEKRSAIYSERPRRPMAELCGFRKALLFQEYGDASRKTRKLLHSELSQMNAQKHVPLQHREVLQFLQRVYLSSDNLLPDTRRLAASIILNISYGYQIKDSNDSFVSISEKVMTYVEKVMTYVEKVMTYVEKVISPNNFLVDALPVLRYLPEWLPGAGFKKEARRCRELLYTMMSGPYTLVLNQMANGTATPSLVSRNLEDKTTTNADEHDLLMWTAGGLFAGGSHSTVAIIMSFVLSMVLHPDVQSKAQAELDLIVQEGRIPTLADRSALPYIDCIIKELHRWRPIAPIAAHSSLVDDIYRGVVIPAGTVIMANAWAFTHDEDIYERPDEFIPERFISPDTPDPRTLVFGFGRRSCPGLYLVDNLLWMVISSTLSTYNIFPEITADGTEILPTTEYTSGAVVQPVPFQCRILPRSQNSMNLIREALAESM